jgi:glycine dehydrogenase
MTHPVFSAHRSETQMMRYIRALERKDIGLDTSMIPARLVHDEAELGDRDAPGDLGQVLARASVAPREQAQGYAEIIATLERALCAITGFAAVSLQPIRALRVSTPASW